MVLEFLGTFLIRSIGLKDLWNISNQIHDFCLRKALAWKASNKLNNIWISNLSKDMKEKLFQATVRREQSQTTLQDLSMDATHVCQGKPSMSTGKLSSYDKQIVVWDSSQCNLSNKKKVSTIC